MRKSWKTWTSDHMRTTPSPTLEADAAKWRNAVREDLKLSDRGRTVGRSRSGRREGDAYVRKTIYTVSADP